MSDEPEEQLKGGHDPIEELLSLGASSGCVQCAAYAEMLNLVMNENQELAAKVGEAELGRRLAEEMLPKELHGFLIDQAAAAVRIAKAKELAALEAELPKGLAYPGPPPTHPHAGPVPSAAVGDSSARQLSFGKYKGKPLGLVPSDYLVWCLNQDWLRPEPRGHMLNVLAERSGKPRTT